MTDAAPGEAAIASADGTPAPARRLAWQPATVVGIVEETRRVRSLLLDVPGWTGHRAGQHVDVRLTAEDGYQAQRSYSIASAPGTERIEITVERIEDGEVSPYLANDVAVGDRFELRGPIGGYFVWTESVGGPLFLVAGGSGVAPLMAMLRHRVAVGSRVAATLLYSSRTIDDVIYRKELDELAARGDGLRIVHTLTRVAPAGWPGYARRIDAAMLGEVGFPPEERPKVFICGPTSLVESASRTLIELGHDARLVKTERFGPTGA